MHSENNVLRGETARKRELARQMRREMTPAEFRLWQHLRANKLDGWHFRRQVVIEGFIVDFYCVRLQLVIEVDGDIHDLQPDYDRERSEILERLGLRMIRFHNDQIMSDVFAVVAAIREEIALIGHPQVLSSE